MNRYGTPPEIIGEFDLQCDEMMAYLYLPIKMAGSRSVRIPKRLLWTRDLIDSVLFIEPDIDDYYIYLTVKRLYVTPDNPGNRPGWHGDGFGTKDINYIWMDKYPTLFCIQDFENISDDHHKSMSEMTEQVREENVTDFGAKNLLRLTEHNIHRTPDIDEGGMRTFVKISLSTQKYNLKGNSHNYLFDYDWEMHDRDKLRNNPYFAETDYVPEQANADLESMFGSQLPENKMNVDANS